MGKLEVLSRSGEPFQAQIQVDSVLPEERVSLRASLASPEAFQAARLVIDPNLQHLRFNVQDGPRAGTAIVKITSAKALPQGFLDALVELSWAGGRVAREYTLTIPADTAASEAKPTELPAITPPRTLPPVATAPATPPKAEAAPPKVTAAPKPDTATPQAPGTASAGELQVKRGDTLSELALQLVGDGITLNQAMAAIYEENREAFINGSVHLIREGAQIRIPNRSAVRARSANEALLVLARNDDRNVYSAYARQIGLLTVANAQAGASPTEGQIAPKPSQAPNTGATQDRLQIAPSAQQGGAAGDANAEELLAKNKALNEANERIALLEKNVSDLQKLLEMQQGGAAPEPAVPPLAASPTESPAANVAEQQTEQPAQEDPALTLPIEAPIASEPAAEPSAEPANQPADQSPPPVETAEPAAEESVNILPWLLAGAGGLIGLVVLLLVARARKKPAPGQEAAGEQDDSFSEVQDFDNALAAMAAEQAKQPEPAPLAKVSDDDFDLDEILAEKEKQPEPVAQVEPEPEPVVEVEPQQIPELESESEQASAQPESLDSPVTLDFPDDAAKPEQSSSILDDLDSLEKGAAAAQSELDELRQKGADATPSDADVDAAFEDLADDGTTSQSNATIDDTAKADVPEGDFDQAVVDLDVDVPNPKIDEATWQEVATKLDLAGAYVEIGDADGAKELLNEIIKKGDVDQVRKAKALLATIG
ncbi:FimV/HubP family polar landmark protein [Limnobacter sp.]|uniref:FimV/HubP family polar landmark protein n=1 Tax=Limnobacter sp. TaxID=2003368 RepID=UPI00351573DC